MKKLICISLLLLYSCSSTSIREGENAPINDYLETQNLGNQKIMIIKEKINNNESIDLFKGRIYFEPVTNEYERDGGVEEPLFKKELWERLKAKYENKYITDYWVKVNYWTLKDFKHQNILFFEIEKFPNPGKYENFNFDNYYTIFSFSEPIYYDENISFSPK